MCSLSFSCSLYYGVELPSATCICPRRVYLYHCLDQRFEGEGRSQGCTTLLLEPCTRIWQLQSYQQPLSVGSVDAALFHIQPTELSVASIPSYPPLLLGVEDLL